jgi:hypothetical protein
MIVELFMAAMAKRRKPLQNPYANQRPDGWTGEATYDYGPRPQAPRNNPSPTYLNKTLETVPAGERREVFALTGPGTFQIFQNKAAISVEVNEIFLFGVVAGNVTILQDEQAQTPVIPIAVNQMYSDSGFRLPVDGRVNLLLTGATQVSGFLRWRYT